MSACHQSHYVYNTRYKQFYTLWTAAGVARQGHVSPIKEKTCFKDKQMTLQREKAYSLSLTQFGCFPHKWRKRLRKYKSLLTQIDAPRIINARLLENCQSSIHTQACVTLRLVTLNQPILPTALGIIWGVPQVNFIAAGPKAGELITSRESKINVASQNIWIYTWVQYIL